LRRGENEESIEGNRGVGPRSGQVRRDGKWCVYGERSGESGERGSKRVASEERWGGGAFELVEAIE